MAAVAVPFRSAPRWRVSTRILAEQSRSRRDSSGRASRRVSSSAHSLVEEADKHCLDLVSRADRASLLCLSALPSEARRAHLVLRAFNVEIASVVEKAPQEQSARLRLQWWKDAIDEMFTSGNGPPHPVAISLLDVIRKDKLSKLWLAKLVHERQVDVHPTQPMTISALEDYCEGTQSALLYQSLHILGIDNVHAMRAASHIGKALGLAVLMRYSGHHISRKRIYHPNELTELLELDPADILKNSKPELLKQATFEVAHVAQQHLAEARKLKADVPAAAYPALASASVADMHLKQLARTDYDVFDVIMKDQFFLPLQLQLVKNQWIGSY